MECFSIYPPSQLNREIASRKDRESLLPSWNDSEEAIDFFWSKIEFIYFRVLHFQEGEIGQDKRKTKWEGLRGLLLLLEDSWP